MREKLARALFGTRRRRALVVRSDRARDRGDWAGSQDALRKALKIDSGIPGLWVQYGHSLKEGGRLADAEEAYRRATEIRPNDFDAFLHLGHVSKRLGATAAAIDAFAEALRLNPECAPARSELLGLGARDALPENGAPGSRRAKEMVALTAGFEAMRRSIAKWVTDAPVPPADYQDFKALYPIGPPPVRAEGSVRVIVLAEGALPAMVRGTLLSLLDQATTDWTACVVGSGLAEHSVASFGRIDARITFSDAIPSMPGLVLWLDAGTIVEDHAIEWMLYAADRTAAAAVYADHDSIASNWITGPLRFAPRLFPIYDPILIATTDELPLAVLTRDGALPGMQSHRTGGGRETQRQLLLMAGSSGTVAHVPRTLFGEMMIPTAITVDDPAPPAARAKRDAGDERGSERITAIIATRDLPEMLATCVESLRRTAAASWLLDILILDNRSVEPATRQLLDRWSSEGMATVVAFDEPFNWSRANNIGAARVENGLLCLVNNDTECLTQDWDARLATLLRRNDVGIVGARLLYPDRTIQHAGVVMGIGRGSPMHEGVGADENDGGPLGRWQQRRSVPAVTGAFLGIRRDFYDEIGGLDEIGLAIGFNDIDLCLKARQRGKRVIYEPAITLLHHESKTRGHNDTLSKLVWDHGELETFHRRWGPAMFRDPGYNPQWSKQGEPFDGFTEPGLRRIIAHIDTSARPDPWAIDAEDLLSRD